MLDLHIFNNPGEYYLFSDGFRPGKTKDLKKCSGTGGHIISEKI